MTVPKQMTSWKDVGEEELKRLYYDEDLSDSEIADLFGIPKTKVAYKRSKYGITFRKKVYRDFVNQHSELFRQLNQDSMDRLLKRGNIEIISKAITHFIFRNGPVEDMHANNQLSQRDMKTLNKYMVNRIAGLLTAIADNDWMQLELLLSFYSLYGTNWDKVEPDMDEINTALKTAVISGF
jgi:predicted DNA-binding protein YlxM (UPF0122 family)